MRVPRPFFWFCWLLIMLTACGGGEPIAEPITAIPASLDPDAPSKGLVTAGRHYPVFVNVPATGDRVAITVFEPTQRTLGVRYPLILHSHGFQGARYQSRPRHMGLFNIDDADPRATDLIDIGVFLDNGYGVISIDQRAHGDSDGAIRMMDPDFEGKNLLAVVDWAERHLEWLQYGASADGKDPHNLLLGAIGASYGGMFQLLLHNIDPRKRLDAIVPYWTPYDLVNSIAPNDVPKPDWSQGLFRTGNRTGEKTGTGFDPFVAQGFRDLIQNRLTPGFKDLLVYHSHRYFCEGTPVATNGGAGTQPELPPVHGGKVHALLVQGLRDTLFNLNEGLKNYECLKAQGGDVRLLTTQIGHNTFRLPPDFQQIAFRPQDASNPLCGDVDTNTVALGFFNLHLKGITSPNSAQRAPICLSMGGRDAVWLHEVPARATNTPANIPPRLILAGVPEAPTFIPLNVSLQAQDALAGVPSIQLKVVQRGELRVGTPVLHIGLGVQRGLLPVVELIGNQVVPVRGFGQHTLDLAGVAHRFAPEEKLVLVVYGGKDQYPLTGLVNLNLSRIGVALVEVSGQVQLPLIRVISGSNP